jgi:transcriptional regulator with XRE-family HTH domain
VGGGTWRERLRLRTVGPGLVRPVPVAVADGLWGDAMVTEQQAELSFAGLLRQLRAEAKLTQEELAAAAGVSPRAVSNLERGFSRTAHKDTAVLLAGALGLTGAAAELFVAAARGTVPAAQVLAAADGAKPRPGAVAGSPYRGLSVFGEQDAGFFFGRGRCTGPDVPAAGGHRAAGGVGGVGRGQVVAAAGGGAAADTGGGAGRRAGGGVVAAGGVHPDPGAAG